MAFRLSMTGFAELQAELAKFPKEQRDHASGILEDFATRARAAVQEAYPHGETGGLRDGVVVYQRPTQDDLRTVWVVDSTSEHAKFYEFGTRHERPHPTFLPITHDSKLAAVLEIGAYVADQGVEVEGARD